MILGYHYIFKSSFSKRYVHLVRKLLNLQIIEQKDVSIWNQCQLFSQEASKSVKQWLHSLSVSVSACTKLGPQRVFQHLDRYVACARLKITAACPLPNYSPRWILFVDTWRRCRFLNVLSDLICFVEVFGTDILDSTYNKQIRLSSLN